MAFADGFPGAVVWLERMVARQNNSIKSLRAFGVSLSFPVMDMSSEFSEGPFGQVNFVESEPEFCFFLQEKVAFTIWDRFFSNANVHDNGSDYKADAVQITCARLGIVIGLRIFDLEIVRTCFQDMRATRRPLEMSCPFPCSFNQSVFSPFPVV